jgi:ABC-type amino acid transport substrate-binding protein
MPVLVAFAALAAPAPSWAQQARPFVPLRIAVEDAADLWSRPDGTGFANEVVRAAFRAVDIDIQLLVVPYARCKQLLVDGSVTACFSMSSAPELHGKALFPRAALFACNTELVQNPARPLRAGRLADLPRGTTVGMVLGYEYPAEVRAAERAGKITFVTAPSETILMRKLSAGRLDAILVNVNETKSLEYVAALAGVATGYQSIEHVGRLESFIGFSASDPRAAQARDAFDEGMHRIVANGILARVQRQWTDTMHLIVRKRGGGRAAARP